MANPYRSLERRTADDQARHARLLPGRMGRRLLRHFAAGLDLGAAGCAAARTGAAPHFVLPLAGIRRTGHSAVRVSAAPRDAPVGHAQHRSLDARRCGSRRSPGAVPALVRRRPHRHDFCFPAAARSAICSSRSGPRPMPCAAPASGKPPSEARSPPSCCAWSIAPSTAPRTPRRSPHLLRLRIRASG